MRDFDDSTLWRISEYERFRAESGQSGFGRKDSATVLPTTLVAELSQLQRQQRSNDALEVVAACTRQRESALILLRHRDLVWPLTLFPRSNLYHLRRPFIDELAAGSRDLEVISVEPAGLRPPGHLMHERIADGSGYRHLPPLLWALAMHAPRVNVLDDIAGRAAYRVSAEFVDEGIMLAGALGPTLRRLRSEIASLKEMATWPGMDRERAARVLNGIYLLGGLIVLRSHSAARHDTSVDRRLLDWVRSRR
jgi:hypothetical protein